MKSIASLADDLGVTPAIIRSWQINLNLQHPRYSPDKAVYNKDWQAYFQEVARLRKQGLSFSKIRAVLQEQKPDPGGLPDLEPEIEPSNGNGNGASEAMSAVDTDEASLHFSVASPERPTPVRRMPESPPSFQASPSFSGNHSTPVAGHSSGHQTNNQAGNSQSLVQMDANLPSMQHLQHNMHEALLQQDMSKMAQTYVQLMENYQTLANRYNESAYIMGQLEEKNRSLEQLMHEKERHFDLQDNQKQAQIKEMENHLQTLRESLGEREDNLSELKSSLQQREQSLEQHQQQLVTKAEVSQVEKQLKLLAVSLFRQQEKSESEAELGFWQRFGRRFRK